MTSEEFKQRFQKHPLGHCFQNMEVTKTVSNLNVTVSMAEGMLLLLDFQDNITKEEYEFLREALQGNTERNLKRLKRTNSSGPSTKQ